MTPHVAASMAGYRDDGHAVVVVTGEVGEAEAHRLRARIEELATRSRVVTVDVSASANVSPAAIDVLAEAGRALDAARRTLLLSRVDPILVRRIAERGYTGVFTVLSPRGGA
jgi:anti-anti-sigma regulatory factor